MIQTYFNKLACIFLFLLPWQTIWIYHEPIINGGKWEYGVLGFYATELLAWGIIIFFLFQYIGIIRSNIFLRDKQFGRDRVFVVCCLLFVVYLFASSLWSPVAELARQQALRITLSFLLFIIFSSRFISFSRAQFWFIAGSIVSSMLGIWQFLSQSTVSSSIFGLAAHKAAEAGTSVVVFGDERWLRAYGSMSHPNVMGGYFVIVLWFIFLYISKKLTLKSKKSFEDYLVLIAGIMASVALTFTFSRSAWIAFVLVLLGTGWWFVKQKMGVRFHLVVIIPAVLCALLFFPVTKTRLFASSAQEARNIEERMESVVSVKDIFFSSPWLGTGVGNYTARMIELQPEKPGYVFQPVHSVPLLILAEIGVAGVALLGVALTGFFMLFRSALKKRLILFVTGVLSLMPLLLFDHYLFSSYIGLLLLTFLITSLVRLPE